MPYYVATQHIKKYERWQTLIHLRHDISRIFLSQIRIHSIENCCHCHQNWIMYLEFRMYFVHFDQFLLCEFAFPSGICLVRLCVYCYKKMVRILAKLLFQLKNTFQKCVHCSRTKCNCLQCLKPEQNSHFTEIPMLNCSHRTIILNNFCTIFIFS